MFNVASIKEILPFSAHLTGFQLVNYLARNIDYLLIGKVLGSQALGFYSLAYKLMMFPLQNFTWVITKVMFPAFSKIQNEMDKVRRNYLVMVKAVALLSFPFMAYLFVTAPDIIHLVYGDNWIVAVPLVRIFCFCGMVQSITSLGGTIYLSKGRADLQFTMALISTFLLSIVLYIAVHHGIESVAFAYTLFYLIWANIAIFVVAKLISLKISKLYKIVWTPFIFSMLLILIMLGIKKLIFLEPLSRVVSFGIIGLIIYAILILLARQVVLKGDQRFTFGEL
jgi:PST family polysaccharide transporter